MHGQIAQRPHEAAPQGTPPSVLGDTRRMVFRTVSYRRTLRADARGAFEAVTTAVQQLGYPRITEGLASPTEVRFNALARIVTVGVVEADPGQAVVTVEFVSLSWMAIGGSALVILPGVLLGAVVKAHDSCFAVGFLSNVQRVLEGREVGWNSARFPGMTALRDRLELYDSRAGA